MCGKAEVDWQQRAYHVVRCGLQRSPDKIVWNGETSFSSTTICDYREMIFKQKLEEHEKTCYR